MRVSNQRKSSSFPKGWEYNDKKMQWQAQISEIQLCVYTQWLHVVFPAFSTDRANPKPHVSRLGGRQPEASFQRGLGFILTVELFEDTTSQWVSKKMVWTSSYPFTDILHERQRGDEANPERQDALRKATGKLGHHQLRSAHSRKHVCKSVSAQMKWRKRAGLSGWPATGSAHNQCS